jgi:di/tricarboxylate transporter
MHFGKQLRLLAYAPWKDHYVDFLRLKKLLKQIVREMQEQGRISGADSIESSPQQSLDQAPPPAAASSASASASSSDQLVAGTDLSSLQTASEPDLPSAAATPQPAGPGDGILMVPIGAKREVHVLLTPEARQRFLEALHDERQRVDAFFLQQTEGAKQQLLRMQGKAAKRQSMSVQRSEEDPSALAPLKKPFFDMLFTIDESLDYSRLNLIGFTKIVKKFVRFTDFKDREGILGEIKMSEFVRRVPETVAFRGQVTAAYVQAFKDPVRPIPDEKLVAELEDSVKAAQSWKMNTILFQFNEHMRKATVKPEARKKTKYLPIALAAVVFLIFCFSPIFHDDDKPAQRCLAILLAATILWVSECWPLFVTALFIPLIVTLSSVLRNPGNAANSYASDDWTIMPYKDAAKDTFKQMFPNNVPLILAGFSIAAAFKRYKIDVRIAMFVLKRKIFRTPGRFLVAVELLCFFMSMWISNVAASVLTLTVIMPVIRDLPEKSRYAKTLVMACAVAGNIGGIPTQIASPQSSVSAGLKEGYSVNFITYIIVALPLCPLLLILGHGLVYAIFRPDIDKLPKLDESQHASQPHETTAASVAAILGAASAPAPAPAESPVPTRKKRGRIFHKFLLKINPYWQPTLVLVITLVSIILWIASPWLAPFGNSIGILSLIPIILFYGLGILTKEDFEHLPWSLAMLISGGSVLGRAVDSSGLLNLAAELLLKLPNNLYLVNVVSCIIMMIAGSFISHTVAALILLSLFAKVGATFNHARLMVMTSVVMCSGAMPLPISSFPNLNAISLTNADGEPYLNTVDFLKIGIPCTILGFIGSITITYGMGLALKL